MNEILRNPWVRLIAVVAGIVIVLRALGALREVITPFLIAFALAYFLNPLVTLLERTFARGGRVAANSIICGTYSVARGYTSAGITFSAATSSRYACV